jgi:type VI secretion system protein ImpL
MVVLGLLRDRLSEMQHRLGSRIWPTIGFLQGSETLGDLKSKYTEWFRSFVLNPTDQAMKGRFSNLEPREREQAMSRYLEYLVWRIDTLKAREKGRSRPDTPGLDGPVDALNLAFAGDLPYEASFFPDMYRSYAAWEDDLGILKRERKDLQVWANRVIEVEGSNLHWMVQWAESRDNLPQVTLDDFWPGPGRVKNGSVVSRAFTTKGKAEIVGLLDQVAQAAADPEDFKKRTEDFWKWYAAKFYSEWGNFADGFDSGLGKLLARNDWLNAGGSMSNLNNPYFKLITRMNKEFDAVRGIMPDAAFSRLAKEFVYLFHTYKAGKSKASLKEKIARDVEKLEAHLVAPGKSADAADSFSEYMKQLNAFAPVMTTMDGAYRFSVQNYGHTSADGDASAMELALAAMNKIRSLLEEDETAEEPFWRLVEGPLFFMVTMTTYETACAVNELWRSQVVAEVSGTPEGRLWDALFGDKGVAGDFLSDTAKPFLKRTSQGWSPRSWLGVPFPFTDEFLTFLDQGSVRRQEVQPKYTVPISTLPTNVNKEARSEPYQTTLTLQCGGGPQSLENFNFPASTDFVWEPGTCGEVSLKIFFRETTLTRTWPGEWGFRDFLREFREGRKVYSPKDFPRQKEILEGLGVDNIQTTYMIEKAESILNLKDYSPLKVPGRAAHCWAGLGEGGMP